MADSHWASGGGLSRRASPYRSSRLHSVSWEHAWMKRETRVSRSRRCDMAATEDLVEARDLSVTLRSSIGPPTLIGPVDLSIPREGVTALVGESGCGKT